MIPWNVSFSATVRSVLAVMLLLLSSCASNHGVRPAAFTADGCTGVPDGPRSDSARWTGACILHDYRYWRGGTWKDRLQADRELAANMAKAGNPVAARIYFIGIRLGGTPWLPTPWRWGYAWGWPRGYGPAIRS